jgi:tripartite-type tricarboxylate transporter receptor subunit TctC
VARLNSEINQALRSIEIREKLMKFGMTPAPGTPEEFGAFLQSESARYAKVVLESGIKAE